MRGNEDVIVRCPHIGLYNLIQSGKGKIRKCEKPHFDEEMRIVPDCFECPDCRTWVPYKVWRKMLNGNV